MIINGKRFSELSFWRRVIKPLFPDNCWAWKGYVDKDGYGRISANTGTGNMLAHRFSYYLHNNSLPITLDIHHICNNRLCVNPKHLKACSHKENMKYRKESK